MKKSLVAMFITSGVLAVSMIACGSAAVDTEEKTAETQIEDAKEPAAALLDSSMAYKIQEMKDSADEVVPTIDINGCDTFTQIVDRKLTTGMGYTNTTIGDEDVLIVSSGTYDNMDGNMASIDGSVFVYNDGVPFEVGKVFSGGTSYPLAVKDGYLYTGSNAWVCKYTFNGDKIEIAELAQVAYDSDGNSYYFYSSEDGGDFITMDQDEAKSKLDGLYAEMEEAEVLNFDTIQ